MAKAAAVKKTKKTPPKSAAKVTAKLVALRTVSIPVIGALWLGHGGYYAGIVKGENGAADYHLIVYPGDVKDTFDGANKWAADLKHEGHKDYTLPTRREQRFLFCNAKDLFENVWYWSSEQRAGVSGYAWFQLFENGYQFSNHKSNLNRVRAVRRLPI